MGIIKITIFQKQINEGINLSMIKKLTSLKSDFLILPEYFYSDKNVTSFKNLKDKYPFATDWLSKLDSSYKGVVVAGSMIREHKGQSFISSPVLSDGQIVDWYNKQDLTKEESTHAEAGNELSSFILGGQRFCVVLGNEIYKPEILEQIKEEKIKLVFSMSMIADSKDLPATLDDEKRIAKIAKDNDLHIMRCSSVGDFMGNKLCGRSLAVNPTGVSWRTCDDEKNSELLKTIVLNIHTL